MPQTVRGVEGPTGAAVVAQIVHWFDSGAVEETFLRLGVDLTQDGA
jgi:hypothetical protein